MDKHSCPLPAEVLTRILSVLAKCRGSFVVLHKKINAGNDYLKQQFA